MKTDNPFNLYPPAVMAQIADDSGIYKINKHSAVTYLSAIMAGVFISIAFVFYITAITATFSIPYCLAKLTDGICFSLDLMLVIIFGVDLFTSTVLTIVSKATGQYAVANGFWGLNVLQVADHKMHHTFIEALCLGILANLMVCLAVWMSYAGRSLIDKLFALILPISMFVASGFEHSIANMFLISFGIVIKEFAPSYDW
ncbi:formate transporter [Xenorhabdus budapestensis]|uniref:Formate transporter n=1 Tax=Xenorhabdus budapestensis TaxID=290110 RepID=A0A2D0IUD1_XENBU|nr:formate transporter [Xenorhabdus budapestensis]